MVCGCVEGVFLALLVSEMWDVVYSVCEFEYDRYGQEGRG